MKNFKLILFMLGIMLLLPSGVKAEGYTITTKVSLNGVTSSFSMILNGITKTSEDYPRYYVCLVKNEESEETFTPEGLPSVSNDATGCHSVNGKTGEVSIHEDWYMIDGYNYAYILKYTSSTLYDTSSKIKFEKPSLSDYGKRYKLTFWINPQRIDPISLFPHISGTGGYGTDAIFKTGDHKITQKIGKMSEEEVNKVYKNNTVSYTDLYTYAKNAEGKEFTATDTDTSSNILGADVSSINFVKGSYYYDYIYYADTVYRDLSDAYLLYYDGKELKQVDTTTSSTNSERETEKLVTVSSDDSNEQNPTTADKNILMLTIVGLLAIFTMIIGSKKIKKV